MTENDLKWRQRAKQHWLKHGDRNTRYFHMQASQRRKINYIKRVEVPQGRIVTEQAEIGGVFTGFFSSLFASTHPTNFENCLFALGSKLDLEMQAWLMTPFNKEHIKDAIFQMNPLGSPGPDGFPAQFYQKHWEVVGEQVCNFALKVLNQGGSLKEVNDTFITLIPKVKNPKRVTDFRPISLCNVVYKIVSKTIANRLKVILPKLISLNQSAFVPGRLISDNTLVAYEILHSMNSRMKEALTALLNQAEACGVLTPVPIGRSPISVNHLFFADDSLFFCQAKAEELRHVLNILDIYEKASGKVINKDKSSIFFSRNTGQAAQQQILELTGVKSCGTFEKYLGLPALVGRAKVASFHTLIDRTWSRVSNWKNKYLSVAGKEVLLKAVLQAIPTYAMGMFLIPISITNKLNQLLRKFWWGFNEDSSKIQWVNWKQLSHSKEMGGLGFRDLRSFNLALLSKQGWRILQNPNSLVGRILKQKYFSKEGLLEAKVGSGPSFAWRGIHAGLSLLKEGLIWRVGNGQHVNIWSAKWLPFSPPYKIQSIREVDCWCEKVSDLIDPQVQQWKEPLLQELFTQQEIIDIKSIPISMRGREDKLVWQFTTNGLYTVKSGYHLNKVLECAQEGETSANLRRRKVVEHSSCLTCKQEAETSGHVLWGCIAAKDVWGQGVKKVQKLSMQSDLIFDIWSRLVEILSLEELEEVAATMRGIWTRRNNTLLGKEFKHPNALYQLAKTELVLYREALAEDIRAKLTANAGFPRWSKPEEGLFKVNWDAAVNQKDRKIGIGVLIRDHHGFFIGSL
ncbi:hypothetical protein F2P56_011261 [Juglans regia]|uniref:Reverse transcriptase domain-containing protein n=1 Tax=Juglans regia TaxID=51240 RepID=A0A834CXL9_JUGRE|nr:hypothetical protein F2P56_011261 [Juglans regia]